MILGLIPARGGSKGMRLNLRNLNCPPSKLVGYHVRISRRII